MFSKFRPMKMKINSCKNIPQLFKDVPPSVTSLTLHFDEVIEGCCGGIRKFKILKLLNCKRTLNILTRYATATDSLTINEECLSQPGVIKYLKQIDCKQIIVVKGNLFNQYLKEFINMQSKAIKFIKYCTTIQYSQIRQVEWTFNYFSPKQYEKELYIRIDQQIDDVEVFFQTLFGGSLKLFKNKRIYSEKRNILNVNVQLPDADTYTQSLYVDNQELVMLALNNCTRLTQLRIAQSGWAKQELKTEKLLLQELIFEHADDSSIPLASDIVKKSKNTLRSLQCKGKVNLTPLRFSTQLRKLSIYGDIDDANLEVIGTFENLEELKTYDQRIVGLFNKSQTLKTLIYSGDSLAKIQDLPHSLTKADVYSVDCTFKIIEKFLEQNPFVKELQISDLFNHDTVQLLQQFQHVKFDFSFDYDLNLFTFKQCYRYLHPDCKQLIIKGTQPDHVLYEFLFQRLTNKQRMLDPYISALARRHYEYLTAPPELMEQLSTFNEFHNSIRNKRIEADHFDRVFNYQMAESADTKYLRIIVRAYDEVFNLKADIHRTVTKLKEMTQQQRETIKRARFFHHCKQNWISPLTDKDFREEEESSEYSSDY
ncbi:hypothetical protein FGO68_gene6842 [Halteria grandinella]|uniref:Uncharacterized protein n=1 Tax=Halteria grandinella TaxID=5974 RepID=A0A8J8T5Q9_HALGN|nr:hypothetical protein FGO68_gene6842 [Halteria grandinella]